MLFPFSSMLRGLFWLPLFFFVMTFEALIADDAEEYVLTYSLISQLEEIETTPPTKYSERHKAEISQVLAQKSTKIRVVTYNVLFDLFDHQLQDATHSWPERLPRIVKSIKNMQPDILCVQEAYPAQLQDLQDSLGPSFSHFIGENTTGELNAIFYKKERFELILKSFRHGSTDLSSGSLCMPFNVKDDAFVASMPGLLPPELEPGKQLILGHFSDKWTGKEFAVMNTHLSFYRINSREDHAYYIAGLAQKLHALGKSVVLTGDFNTFPNRPGLDFRFYDGSHICQIIERQLKDTKESALLGHIGPLCTSLKDFLSRAGKPLQNTESPEVILDHIFVSPQVTVIINAIEPCLVNGHFPSDHMPVVADLLLP